LKRYILNNKATPLITALNKCFDLLNDKGSKTYFGVWVIEDLEGNYFEDVVNIAQILKTEPIFKLVVATFIAERFLQSRFPFITLDSVKITSLNLRETFSLFHTEAQPDDNDNISFVNDPLWWDYYLLQSVCSQIHKYKALPLHGLSLNQLKLALRDYLDHLKKIDKTRKWCSVVFPQDCESKWNELIDTLLQISENFSQKQYEKIRRDLYVGLIEIEGKLRITWNTKKGEEPWLKTSC